MGNAELRRDQIEGLVEIIFATKQNIDKAVEIIERANLRKYNSSAIYHPEAV